MSGGKRAAVADDTVAKKLYAATTKLREAQQELARLQQLYKPGDSAWHQCETVDDRLHDALALLGD